MTIKQQETIDRNNRVIAYIEKNFDVIKDDKDFVLFFNKLKRDNESSVRSGELWENDKTVSVAKVEAKMTVCKNAEELCSRAMCVIDLKEGEDISVAVEFSYKYFFDASDNLAIERLSRIHQILKKRYESISSVITLVQLDIFQSQIDYFLFTDGSTLDITKAASLFNIKFKKDLILTNTDMKNILKSAVAYENSHAEFAEGVKAACGIIVYRGYRKKKI